MFIITVFIITATFAGSLLLRSIARHSMHKNPGPEPAFNSKNYLFYLFYYNPDDKRIIVPRKSNPGFTVNFARPPVILVILALAGWIASGIQ